MHWIIKRKQLQSSAKCYIEHVFSVENTRIKKRPGIALFDKIAPYSILKNISKFGCLQANDVKICQFLLKDETDFWMPGIAVVQLSDQSQNPHLLCKGKYHYTAADLLFYLLTCRCFACVDLTKDLHVWLNPDLSNWR